MCAAYACDMNMRLQMERGIVEVMAPCVKYCMHRVKMLQHYGTTPVIVFDGGDLPLKHGTNEERRR